MPTPTYLSSPGRLQSHNAVMKGRRGFDSVEDFPKPVIAMINGFALEG
ncbi:MAG TPA: hypothetical protein VFB82_16195 [Blastocatellia bacterium]|nr:hypothetical protein [Blastocatellia bacterium]